MNREELEQRLPWSSERGGTIECGDGWLWIIEELNEKITAFTPNYRVAQIKEKFGGLRYYTWDVDYSLIANLIREAEEAAARTCEICGQPGQLRGDRWVRTVCEQDA